MPAAVPMVLAIFDPLLETAPRQRAKNTAGFHENTAFLHFDGLVACASYRMRPVVKLPAMKPVLNCLRQAYLFNHTSTTCARTHTHTFAWAYASLLYLGHPYGVVSSRAKHYLGPEPSTLP